MIKADYIIFSKLYREAYQRCFNQQLKRSINETESKLFYNQILEQTGLAIGWRSLKNYSFYLFKDQSERLENPSIATLDTLSRYVLNAPYTTEISRKNDEAHYPYWFLYKSRCLQTSGKKFAKKGLFQIAVLFLLLIILPLTMYFWIRYPRQTYFTDNFKALGDNDIFKRGWHLLNPNTDYWKKRQAYKYGLRLYTLPGDNWPDNTQKSEIKNLLFRSLSEECFIAEIQLSNFIPRSEWQQAGLLLLTDSSTNSPSIRISIAYNDFYGGLIKPSEIIVQGVQTTGNEDKPEEFIHYRILSTEMMVQNPVLANNFNCTALRIEKQGSRYRFLYSSGSKANEAFKELIIKDISIEPRYIAIFALKGRITKTPIIPVNISKFILQEIPCK